MDEMEKLEKVPERLTTEHLLAIRDLPLKVVQLKAEAGRLGMFRTMHALEAATHAVGYELADIVSADDSAALNQKGPDNAG